MAPGGTLTKRIRRRVGSFNRPLFPLRGTFGLLKLGSIPGVLVWSFVVTFIDYIISSEVPTTLTTFELSVVQRSQD